MESLWSNMAERRLELMGQNDKIQLFEDKRIRTAWDEEKEEWFFRSEERRVGKECGS